MSWGISVKMELSYIPKIGITKRRISTSAEE
jgi:hypothetical protein